MMDTKTERNCIRFSLETTSYQLEDEIYRLTKQMERGTSPQPLETDRQLKNAKMRLATVRMLMNKLGPYESGEQERVEVPDALDLPHTL